MKLSDLADFLRVQRDAVPCLRADEMITVVEERGNLLNYRRVEDIARFGDLVKQAAGHSSLREIVVTATHPGGCAVNMGDGLAALGIKVDTFATLGEPIHPAFAEYGQLATLHSWGREPGRTLAFEFADGKLMFSAVTQLAEFDVERVRGYLADGRFARACASARLIALTDWTLYPHMTAVWRMLDEEVFSRLEGRPWLFVDLVDPSSRSERDIRGMLEALRKFNASARVVLGLNQNEANILSRVLGSCPPAKPDKRGAAMQAAAIRQALGIEQLVIHAHAHAVCACRDGEAAVDGPWCAKPLKSTGAGDRFNAGFALGLLLGMAPEDCLLTAAASSGFFVRGARSASIEELVTFIGDWAAGALD